MQYTIANGETMTRTFATGDIILVKNGGTLADSVIPLGVASVTLESGSNLSGTIRTAKEITLSGSSAVNASAADLVLDISERKPENDLGIMISDLTLLICYLLLSDRNDLTYSDTLRSSYSF